jgi:hypothetical protein
VGTKTTRRESYRLGRHPGQVEHDVQRRVVASRIVEGEEPVRCRLVQGLRVGLGKEQDLLARTRGGRQVERVPAAFRLLFEGLRVLVGEAHYSLLRLAADGGEVKGEPPVIRSLVERAGARVREAPDHLRLDEGCGEVKGEPVIAISFVERASTRRRTTSNVSY